MLFLAINTSLVFNGFNDCSAEKALHKGAKKNLKSDTDYIKDGKNL